MKNHLSLRANFKWMFISNIIFTMFQWFILIIIAKFGDQESVGIYTLGLAITAPIITFSYLQLRVLVATDAKNNNEFKDYFTLRFIFMFLSLFFVLLLMILSNYTLDVKLIILFIAFSKAIEGLSDIIYGYFQKVESMKKIALSLIIRGFSNFIIFFLAFLMFENLLIAITASSISWILILIFYDKRNLKELKIEKFFIFKKNVLYSLFLISLPMGLVTMLGSLSTNIPRYLIEEFVSLEALGIFGAIMYIMTGASKFTTSITQTVSPRLAKYYTSNNRKAFISLFNKVLLVNVFIGIVGLVVTLFFGELILTIIYTPDYANHVLLLQLVMLFSLVSYVFNVIGVAVTSMRLFAAQLPIQLLKVITIIFTSIFLIKEYGLEGAVWSLIISTIVSGLFYIKLFIKGYRKMEVLND